MPFASSQPNGTCRRCSTALLAERLFLCAKCEGQVADAIERRAFRDGAEGLERRLQLSGLPRDYQSGKRGIGDAPAWVIETYQPSLGTAEVPGLFLTGEARRFKTTIGAALLADGIRSGGSGRIVDVTDLMVDVQRSYRDDVESRAQIVERFALAPMLVLDDIGHTKATHHAGEVLRQILDRRVREWRAGWWTILTTQFTAESLVSRFDEPELADSILHRISRLTVIVPVDGQLGSSRQPRVLDAW